MNRIAALLFGSNFEGANPKDLTGREQLGPARDHPGHP